MSELEHGFSEEEATRMREMVRLEARIVALEIFNNELKPEIKDVASKNLKLFGASIGALVTVIGLLLGLVRYAQVSDSQVNTVSIHHLETHVHDIEVTHKEIRNYIDSRNDRIYSVVFLKAEHEIFDKERQAELQNIEQRLLYLERRGAK